MKKLLAFLAVVALLAFGCRLYSIQHSELVRCRADRTALLERLSDTALRSDSLVAENDRLTLSVEELRSSQKRLMRRIRELEITPKRVESVSETAMLTEVALRAPLQPPLADSLRRFEWADPWTKVSGVVAAESVVCSVESVDTLVQVIHRVPYRWWFFSWGTKAVRQTIGSSNPHTRIVYSEYIEIR